MKPGDVVEIAFWLSGKETEEQLKHWKEVFCTDVVKRTEHANNVEIGPLEFSVKKPGDDRVPNVPDEISGPDVKLIVAEAKVGGYKLAPLQTQSGFVYDLTKTDLHRLRSITRKAHAKRTGQRLTDAQCDQVIEHLGPDVAIKTLNDETHH